MIYQNIAKIKHRAFSLIELSIVILIIGILVAGVTQSSRLVNQFRLTSARNITLNSPVATIKDLALWFDAVNEKGFDSQISDGAGIAYWQDINPLNSTQLRISQSNPPDQPLFVSNGINGLPSIKFNATSNNSRLMSYGMGAISRDSTIFLVLRWDIVSPVISQSYIIHIGGDSPVASYLEAGMGNVGNMFFYFYPSGSFGGDSLSGTMSNNTNHIFRRIYNTRTNFSGIYLNGTNLSTSTAYYPGNYSSNGNTLICLGNHFVAPRTFGGLFGEFIIFNRALANDEIIDVERYLSKKWSIKLSY
jgi:prepilin-type N-terminal cleavage/methylation domain-containing protein